MGTKYTTTVTPVGEFVFPALLPGSPDNFMNKKNYKADLKFQSREDIQDLITLCEAELEKFCKDEGIPMADWDIKPIFKDASWEDKESGEQRDEGSIKIESRMAAQYIRGEALQTNVPVRVDHNGEALPDSEDINHGDFGRIMVALKPYKYDDKGFLGVRLMLNGVQLVKRGSGGGAQAVASSFGAVDPEDFVE